MTSDERQARAVEAAMAELERQHEAPGSGGSLLYDTTSTDSIGIDGRVDVEALVRAVLTGAGEAK